MNDITQASYALLFKRNGITRSVDISLQRDNQEDCTDTGFFVGVGLPNPLGEEVLPMKLKSNQPRRRATRLRGCDYGQTGGYLVTICVQDQKCLFGTIIDGQMRLNEIGKIVV